MHSNNKINFPFFYPRLIGGFLLFLFVLSPLFSFAQVDNSNKTIDKVAIRQILIEGNKKTKEQTILRELDLTLGDSIAIEDLNKRLEINQQNVQNTNLFVTSEIKIDDWNTLEHYIVLKIIVRETWYLYPYVLFDLADRNFNVWWTEQNRSLRRVNYGISIDHRNLTGRRDKFKITIQGGYTQKYELDYNLPGVNKKQTIGLFGNVFYSRRKEIAYITQDNKLLFYSFDDEFQLKRFRLSAGMTLRPKLYHYHTFKVQWSDNEIGEQIESDLNPEYFLNGTTRQRHLTFQYRFTADRRDVKPYPLNGYMLNLNFQRDGFGITNDVNAMHIQARYLQYFSFWRDKKFSVELHGRWRSQLIRKKQPYTHLTSLGYGDNEVRGYELYVVDGMDSAVLRTSFRYELLNKQFNFGKHMPIHAFRVLPMRIYLGINNDTGYLNSPYYSHYGNLHNQVLWGGGFGLDIVMYHDKVFRIQYSINHLKEKGLFLHFKFN